MPEAFVRLADQAVRLRYPASLQLVISALLPSSSNLSREAIVHDLTVLESSDGQYSIESHCDEPVVDVPDGDLPRVLLEEIGRSLVFDMKSAVAIHSGAVASGKDAVLIVGQTGAGKSSLTAWLASHGFAYLSDELVVIDADLQVEPHRRPIIVKPAGTAAVGALAVVKRSQVITSGPNQILIGPPAAPSQDLYRCGLIIFVAFTPGADAQIAMLTPAQAATRLMAANLNARNLPAHGLPMLRDLAKATLAIELRYGAFDQLPGVVDRLIRWSLQSRLGAAELRRLLSALAPSREAVGPAPAPAPVDRPIPPPTIQRYAKKLTIGMATYDDFDGAYFSLQALRLYHSDVIDQIEFVVIDNHPSGPGAEPLKKFEKWIPNYRYVPRSEMSGTAIRNAVFEEASGQFVLCIDSHVLIEPGALSKLIGYIDHNPECCDLLQGPLIYDDLTSSSTHFVPKWRQGMYGHWGSDPRGDDPAAPPFDIPMQGLGLFACRRDAWLPFNPAFRGFGGEEGYIHEKFRQAGRRTLCLPFLRWLHRFQRPLGVPYKVKWEDRVRNYWIGLKELSLPTDEMEAHFVELLGADAVSAIMEDIHEEFGHPAASSGFTAG